MSRIHFLDGITTSKINRISRKVIYPLSFALDKAEEAIANAFFKRVSQQLERARRASSAPEEQQRQIPVNSEIGKFINLIGNISALMLFVGGGYFLMDSLPAEGGSGVDAYITPVLITVMTIISVFIELKTFASLAQIHEQSKQK